MIDETFNGYSNRETWAVCLWLDNDEVMHEDTRNKSARFLRDYIDRLKEYAPDSEAIRNMFDDIGSLWRVDWDEVESNCKDED